MKPDDAHAWYHRGIAYKRLGDEVKAETISQKAKVLGYKVKAENDFLKATALGYKAKNEP